MNKEITHRMEKVIYILTLLLFTCTGIQAQNKRLSKEEFQNKQKEFIISRAQLSSKEAEKFFPLYFELQKKKNGLNREAWEQMRKGKENNLSETEYSRIIENVVKNRIATDELDLEYLKKYKEFLSSKKIYMIQRAEMRFHRELLKDAKKK